MNTAVVGYTIVGAFAKLKENINILAHEWVRIFLDTTKHSALPNNIQSVGPNQGHNLTTQQCDDIVSNEILIKSLNVGN